MSEEKRMLGNYEVTQSIYVGDKEVVLAVDRYVRWRFESGCSYAGWKV